MPSRSHDPLPHVLSRGLDCTSPAILFAVTGRFLLSTTATEGVRHGAITLMARIFEDPIRGTNLGHRNRCGPGASKRLRIVNREPVVDRVGIHARESLHHTQVLSVSDAGGDSANRMD